MKGTISYPSGKSFYWSNFCKYCQIEFPFICASCPNCSRPYSANFARYKSRRQRKLGVIIEKMFEDIIQKELMSSYPTVCDLQ